MKVIWIIAANTYKEIIRDRILYGLVVFAILLIGLSLALGELSFQEAARITADFGLMGVHLSAVILAIFVGSTLVSKEIEKRTIFTLLAHAVTRTQFLVAKTLGMIMVMVTVMAGLSVILLALFYHLGMKIEPVFFMSLVGILAEASILLSLTVLFGIITRPLLAVSFTMGLFLIGHWLNDLKFFAEKSEDSSYRLFAMTLNYMLPNLERFNWRSNVTFFEPIADDVFFSALAYAVCWIVVAVATAALIFRRRDFV